jgi:hypothetical protein
MTNDKLLQKKRALLSDPLLSAVSADVGVCVCVCRWALFNYYSAKNLVSPTVQQYH